MSLPHRARVVLLRRAEEFAAREPIVSARMLRNQSAWVNLVQPEFTVHIHEIFFRIAAAVANETAQQGIDSAPSDAKGVDTRLAGR